LSEIDVRHPTSEALAWQEQQDLESTKQLHELPSFASLLSRVSALSETRQVHPPLRRGTRWFQRVDLSDDSQQSAFVVWDGAAGERRVLVNPDALSAERGTPVSLTDVAPSPTGRYLMYGLAEGGTEQTTIHVLDVESGQELPENIPFLAAGGARWLDDESGFWIATREFRDGAFSMALRLHRLGATEPAPAEDLPPDTWIPQPLPSGDGRWVVASCGNTEIKAAYLRTPEGRWIPFLRDLPGGSSGAVVGESWVCVLDGDDARGRLVRVPFATFGDRETWVELVPAGDDVLRSVAAIGDELLVHGFLRDGACGLRVLRLDGTVVEELALPAPGTIAAVPFPGSTPLVPMVIADPNGFSFWYSSFQRSPAAYRWEPGSGLREVMPPELVLDDLSIELLWATSADGTRIPCHVVRRTNAPRGPVPTLLHGYGGFNIAMTPGYLVRAAAWADAGGAFVLAHLRGGSEYGRDWWLQGRMSEKQNVFDDFYAVAEKLVASGLTTADQLAIHGGSNGGLLMGVAITQRPELWAAVAAEAPVLDLLDVEGEPMSGAIIASEYGNPAAPEQRAWLAAYSPVHNVRADADYPPLLVVSGQNDPRCPPWHGRLFVQKLQAASTKPALLRVPTGTGHGPVERTMREQLLTEVLAFCAEHTGLKPAG
jgi:prolyl oligopeptidase